MQIERYFFKVHFYSEPSFFRIIVRDTLTESEGVGNVVTLVRDDDVDVVFGSPSSSSKYNTVKLHTIV